MRNRRIPSHREAAPALPHRFPAYSTIARRFHYIPALCYVQPYAGGSPYPGGSRSLPGYPAISAVSQSPPYPGGSHYLSVSRHFLVFTAVSYCFRYIPLFPPFRNLRRTPAVHRVPAVPGASAYPGGSRSFSVSRRFPAYRNSPPVRGSLPEGSGNAFVRGGAYLSRERPACSRSPTAPPGWISANCSLR